MKRFCASYKLSYANGYKLLPLISPSIICGKPGLLTNLDLECTAIEKFTDYQSYSVDEENIL